MRRTQAWEQLNNPEYSGRLSMGEFYDLLVRAGYSKMVARKAANKRGYDRLEAGVTI